MTAAFTPRDLGGRSDGLGGSASNIMPLIEVISSEENDPAVSSAPKPATAAEVAAGIGALGLDPAQHHGGSEWSQVEPVGLTNTERAQMDELREKYGKYQRERDAVGGGDAPHTEHALAQAQARMDAEFRARDAAQPGSDGDDADDAGREAVAPSSRIKVCDVCRGMRVTKTEYNHRVMERMCERCEGEGVLQDGKPIVTPGEAAAEEAKRSATDPPSSSSGAAGDDDDAMRRRVQEAIAKDDRLMRYTELSTVCDAIEEKMDGYAQEIVEANARLDGDDASAELEAAVHELVKQITLHRATLRGKLEEYRAELGPLEEELERDGTFASFADLETDADELP